MSETIGHSALTVIDHTAKPAGPGVIPKRDDRNELLEALEMATAEKAVGEIRAHVRELGGWMEALEQSVTPQPTGGQQCSTTSDLRSSLRHLITVAGRLWELIG